MTSEELGGFPHQPPSVAEWEDLLVRVEIAPRVVRNLLEERDAGAPTRRILQEAVRREAAVGRILETAAGGGEVASPAATSFPDDAEGLALRFASLRARTFAMLQRRGLEVWGWEARLEDGGRATVFQLLGWLVGRDAATLAELRAVQRTAGEPAGTGSGPRTGREGSQAC